MGFRGETPGWKDAPGADRTMRRHWLRCGERALLLRGTTWALPRSENRSGTLPRMRSEHEAQAHLRVRRGCLCYVTRVPSLAASLDHVPEKHHPVPDAFRMVSFTTMLVSLTETWRAWQASSGNVSCWQQAELSEA